MAGFYAATTQRPDATAPWPTISPPHTADLRRRAARLEAEVNAQQAAEEQARSLQRVIGQLDLFAAMVHDRLADADWSTKRDIICTLVKRIEVTADSVRIVFRVEPGSSAPSEPRRNLPYCPTRRHPPSHAVRRQRVPLVEKGGSRGMSLG